MKPWRSMMKLRQPVKGGLVAYLIAFAVVFVSVPASAIFTEGKQNPVMPWSLTALGLTAIVLGVMLAADLRGSTRAYASMIKDHKPMGSTTPNRSSPTRRSSGSSAPCSRSSASGSS